MDNIQINSVTNTTDSATFPAYSPVEKISSSNDSSSSKITEAITNKENNISKTETTVSDIIAEKIEENKDNKDDKLSNLSDRSEDGDTLEISPEGSSDLNDGYVVRIKISSESSDNSETQASEETTSALDSFESRLTSFKGISNQELRRMYLNGIISPYDYNEEMDARGERAAAIRDNSVKTSHTITAVVSSSNEISETANQIKSAYGGEAKNSEISTEFIKAMDSVGKTHQNDMESQLNIDIG
ncbi:hypothetical protein QYZ88_004745 [Lachnospiraceae bacterium C1.1]|nr:hypothetical protein [Lachnospiraceae bacterium C1.1]